MCFVYDRWQFHPRLRQNQTPNPPKTTNPSRTAPYTHRGIPAEAVGGGALVGVATGAAEVGGAVGVA